MRVLFAGTNAIGEEVLRLLIAEHSLVGVLTQPDRPAGRRRELTSPPIKKLASEMAPHAPIFQPENLRDSSLLESLKELKPEVLVTFSYGKIIPLALLTLPTIASLNVHASLLPRHRGASPIQASIMAGDLESGITIMYMAEGLDTGDILLTKKLQLSSRETAGTLTARLAALAPSALQEALLELQEGKAARIPQDIHFVTHTHRITRNEATLHWSRSATALDQLIRAMNPKPGAHGVVLLPSGKKITLKIFAAQPIANLTEVLEEAVASTPSGSPLQEPGSVLILKNREPILLCGSGALLLEEVQPEGGARMSGRAFLCGHS